jgi:hypothetical protein
LPVLWAHVLHCAPQVLKPTTSPAGNVTLTIGIIPRIEKWGLVFTFIADTTSKRAKIKKSCS